MKIYISERDRKIRDQMCTYRTTEMRNKILYVHVNNFLSDYFIICAHNTSTLHRRIQIRTHIVLELTDSLILLPSVTRTYFKCATTIIILLSTDTDDKLADKSIYNFRVISARAILSCSKYVRTR